MEITRIVKLTIKPDHVNDFERFFAEHQKTIASSDGCLEVNAYKEEGEAHVFFTISRWESTQKLEDYRNSSFFQKIWPKVKQWFAAKAEAHTLKNTTNTF